MDLGTLLDGFDPTLPLERARTPPASWYIDPHIARLEAEAVFECTWQLVARRDQLTHAGDYVAVDIGDQPIVVVRGEDGALRAFANVCRHKGTTLCHGPGRADHRGLICPYHGWRYGLDGQLLAAPHMGAIQDFERRTMGLTALGVCTWGQWVFVHADPAAPALTLAELEADLDVGPACGLVCRGRRTWQVACNWKVFCDNYLDGGYHIAHMHPSLDAQLDMGTYTTTLFDRYSVQASSGRDARIGDGAVYAWIYPNLMINRYGPNLDTNLVLPGPTPNRCTVTFEWFFEPDRPEAEVEASIAQSVVTQEEDILISERVQRGMGSRHYDTGRYAPRFEAGTYHFHRLLAHDLRTRP